MKGVMEVGFTKNDVVKKKGGKDIVKGVPLNLRTSLVSPGLSHKPLKVIGDKTQRAQAPNRGESHTLRATEFSAEHRKFADHVPRSRLYANEEARSTRLGAARGEKEPSGGSRIRYTNVQPIDVLYT